MWFRVTGRVLSPSFLWGPPASSAHCSCPPLPACVYSAPIQFCEHRRSKGRGKASTCLWGLHEPIRKKQPLWADTRLCNGVLLVGCLDPPSPFSRYFRAAQKLHYVLQVPPQGREELPAHRYLRDMGKAVVKVG